MALLTKPQLPQNDSRALGRRIARELFGSLVDADRTLLPTLWHLMTRPRALLNHYLTQGADATGQYMNPFRLATILVGVLLTIMFLRVDFETMNLQSTQAINESLQLNSEVTRRQAAAQQEVRSFIETYLSLISLAFIPVLAFCSRLFFRRVPLYWVHLAAAAYGYSFTTVLHLVGALGLFGPSPEAYYLNFYFPYSILTSLLCSSVVLGALVEPRTLWDYVKCVLSVVVSWLGFFFIMGLIGAVAGVIYMLGSSGA